MNVNSIDDIKSIQGDGILVKQLLDNNTRKSGLVVPDTMIDKLSRRRKSAYKAEVVLVGPMVDHDWLLPKRGIKKGDVVHCAPVSLDCPSFEIDKQIYRIIRDEDVLAMEVK